MSRLLVAVAALSVATITACPADDAPAPEGGVAATVDGAQVAAEQVEQRFDELAEVDDGVEDDPGTAAEVRARILSQLIIAHVTATGAEEMAVEVDTRDVADIRMELVDSVGGEAELERHMAQTGVSPQRLDDELHALASLHAVGRELVGEEARTAAEDATEAEIQAAAREWLDEQLSTADVVVDEGYGRWDEARHVVVPPEPGRT